MNENTVKLIIWFICNWTHISSFACFQTLEISLTSLLNILKSSTLMCISNVFFPDKKDLLISLAALHSPYQKLNWVHFGFLNKKNRFCYKTWNSNKLLLKEYWSLSLVQPFLLQSDANHHLQSRVCVTVENRAHPGKLSMTSVIY